MRQAKISSPAIRTDVSLRAEEIPIADTPQPLTVSNYPSALDSIVANFEEDDPQHIVHVKHHNDLADSVNSLQTTMGVNPQGPFADVAARLASLASSLTMTEIFVNVKTVGGAVGNGTTDDKAAINAAIAALPSVGGVLFFPPGSYKADISGGGFSQLPDNTIVMGSGRSSKIAVAPAGLNVSVAAFFSDTTRSCEIRDLWIDGPASYGASGNLRAIHKQGTTGRVLINNVYVTNCSYGVKCDSQAEVYVENSELIGPPPSTASVAATGIYHGGTAGKLHVSNTKLDTWGKTGTNQHHGIYVDRSPGFFAFRVSIDHITGGFAIQIFGTNTGPQYDHLVGCYFGPNCAFGLVTNSLGTTTVTNCTFAMTLQALTPWGNTIATNCIFAGSGGSDHQIAPGQAGSSNWLELRNCVFTGSNAEDIRLDTTGWTFNVMGCRFLGAAGDHIRITSGGTDAILQSSGNWFHGATATAIKVESGTLAVSDGDHFKMSGASARAIRNLTSSIAQLRVYRPDFSQTSDSLLFTVTPTVWEVRDAYGSKGFPTRNGGVASKANGGTIAHGLGSSAVSVTPTKYGVNGTVAKHTAVVTAVDGTNLTIALHDDTGTAVTVAENVSWWAER